MDKLPDWFLDSLMDAYRDALASGKQDIITQVLSVCREKGILGTLDTSTPGDRIRTDNQYNCLFALCEEMGISLPGDRTVHDAIEALQGETGLDADTLLRGTRSGDAKSFMREMTSLRQANKQTSEACKQKAKSYPQGSSERKIYERYAESLSGPQPGRPTAQESKEYTKKFLDNISTQLEPYAVERYKRDLENEPRITSDLCDITDAIGTEMFGLDYRLKKASDSKDGGCRIADKIAGDMKSDGLTYEQAVDGIGDIVRYTVACTPENLTKNFLKTERALEEKGYSIRKVKNSFESFTEKRPYRGLNCSFVSPDGTPFEVQFHTAESLVAKEVQHGWYEEYRDERTSADRKAEVAKKMYANMSGITTPEGIHKIRNRP